MNPHQSKRLLTRRHIIHSGLKASIALGAATLFPGACVGHSGSGSRSGDGSGGSDGESGASSPPNILYIISDQLRAQALNCYGGPFPGLTPNLDRLFTMGVRFNRCYSNNPKCGPNRTSLMVADYAYPRYPTYGENGGRLPDWAETYGQALKRSTNDLYQSWYFGKFHLTGRNDEENEESTRGYIHNGEYGFQRWDYGFDGGHIYMGAPDEIEFETHPERYSYTFQRATEGWKEGNDPPLLNPRPMNSYEPEEQTRRELIPVLESVTDRPFNICFNFGPPHGSRPHPFYGNRHPNSPQEILDALERDCGVTWEGAITDWVRARANIFYRDERLQEAILDQHIYYAMVHQLDGMVGEIMATLDRKGLWENTIVVFTSDHGDFLAEHAELKISGKGRPDEGSARCPLLIAWKGKIVPRSTDALVTSADIPATILGLAGASFQNPVAGRDFSTQLLSGSEIASHTLLMQGKCDEKDNKSWRAVVHREESGELFKYSKRLDNDPLEKKLFKLEGDEADPLELSNLWGQQTDREIEEKLDASLEGLRRQYGEL